MLDTLKRLLDGHKTVIAAIGLIGLALYQFSQGQVEPGMQSLLAGLTALGLRHAVEKATL